MADSRPGWFRRILFWSFVLLVAVMTGFRLFAPDRRRVMRPVRTGLWLSVALTAFAVSVSVGLADSPSVLPMPRKDPKAAKGVDAAALLLDPRDPKVIEAAALAAQQVLHRLEALETREPKPPEPWAKKGMGPGDPVAIHHVYRKPDGSLIPHQGGVHPVQLREWLRHLAFTGRISKLEYIQFRNDILNIPLRLHAIPEEITYP